MIVMGSPLQLPIIDSLCIRVACHNVMIVQYSLLATRYE